MGGAARASTIGAYGANEPELSRRNATQLTDSVWSRYGGNSFPGWLPSASVRTDTITS